MCAYEPPPPDARAVPQGFVVEVESGDRVHFLDWGQPDGEAEPGVLLIHGLAATAWAWIAVARRLVRGRWTVAMDLRGHGLSDSPTAGYHEVGFVEDVVAVGEGSGLLTRSDARIVLAGHGFGASVAAWTAATLGDRCAGLVLVDGGWEDVAETSGVEPDEFLRGLAEPPEVLRSMAAYLADREAFDPSSWDADQEAAARATVVETHAGRVVPVIRPHALARTVEAMFDYRPTLVLPSVAAPIVALAAADDADGTSSRARLAVQRSLAAAGRPPMRVTELPSAGHNLLRYRPAEVTAAILDVARRAPD